MDWKQESAFMTSQPITLPRSVKYDVHFGGYGKDLMSSLQKKMLLQQPEAPYIFFSSHVIFFKIFLSLLLTQCHLRRMVRFGIRIQLGSYRKQEILLICMPALCSTESLNWLSNNEARYVKIYFFKKENPNTYSGVFSSFSLQPRKQQNYWNYSKRKKGREKGKKKGRKPKKIEKAKISKSSFDFRN